MKSLSTYLTLFLILIAATIPMGVAEQSGPFFGLGVGSSPIYIEEQIESDQLVSGITTIAFHSQLSLGYSFSEQLHLGLMASQNFYMDENSALIASGVLGLKTIYTPRYFYNTYFSLGIGSANKNRFSTSEQATGFGYLVGFGQKLSKRFALELALQSLFFSETVIDAEPGMSEDISSVQINLMYQTF